MGEVCWNWQIVNIQISLPFNSRKQLYMLLGGKKLATISLCTLKMPSFLGIAVCPLIKVTQQVVWERIRKRKLGLILSGLWSVDSTVLNCRVALHPVESTQKRFFEKATCFVLFFTFVVCIQMHSEGQMSARRERGTSQWCWVSPLVCCQFWNKELPLGKVQGPVLFFIN